MRREFGGLDLTLALLPDRARWPWDVAIDTTRPALARAMEALIITGSEMTDSFRLRNRDGLGRGVTAFLKVKIQEGAEARFREICNPVDMRPPPRVQIGTADDGHPGRKR